MKAQFVSENIKFERGQNPKYAMNLGIAEEIANSTSDAYSFDRYGKALWTEIIQWLLSGGYTPDQIEIILRSKFMRWGMDYMVGFDEVSLDAFEAWIESKEDDIQAMIEELGPPELSEDMGGVSAPMATMVNTPGMGNVVPGAGPDGIGSGDSFDSSSGPCTQDGKKKRKRKKKKKKLVNEMNINPYDPVGVAMAKKLGAALPFKKGKGDQDVEQVRVDKDIDLDTDKDGMMSIEEWQKKFLET